MRRRPHDVVRIETVEGEKLDVTFCMIERLEGEEIDDGLVAADMPEYDEPEGAGCHPDWRGGCDYGGSP